MIYQELTVLDNLDVGRNIMLGQEPLLALNQVNWKALYERARQVLAELELEFDVRTPLSRLNLAQQQMVEIARAVQRNPRLIIMDEPSSALGKHEEQVLFDLIRRLKSRNVSIIYISHRMDEVFLLADTITVLRDGRHITTRAAAELNREKLIELMVGRKVEATKPEQRKFGGTILKTRRLSKGKSLCGLNLELRSGEILGVAGLAGAGQTVLAQLLFGADKPDEGDILLDGKTVRLYSPQDAISQGIAYVPEDRKQLGLVLSMALQANLTLASLKQHSQLGISKNQQLRKTAQGWVEQLAIRTPSLRQGVESLSGGNQQKVVLAKWLSLKPRLLILNEPTRGIDIGAKAEVHKLIRDIALEGVAVLMISSELPEVLAISDRIIVMWQGRITGEMPRSEASEAQILRLAFGQEAA
jgi:ABC-type sugar transport system ATPase subunit